MTDKTLEQAPPVDVRTSRRFKRTVVLGMKVWRSMTINFDCKFAVEHVEMACPNYKLTDRGPVLETNEEIDDANNE